MKGEIRIFSTGYPQIAEIRGGVSASINPDYNPCVLRVPVDTTSIGAYQGTSQIEVCKIKKFCKPCRNAQKEGVSCKVYTNEDQARVVASDFCLLKSR